MSVPKVMIVDDNPYNVELASFVLTTDGLEVAVAVNAADALAQIPVFQPDLILMDVQMPGMDGLELTRRLKADPATSHVRIVAFTAYAMKGDEEKMLAAGCDAYLSKPIEVATFARQVKAYLAPAG
jgi:CheY-like chemotaxis protein